MYKRQLVGSYNKDMDDDIGTTSILCHSDKGKKLLEQPDVILSLIHI